MSEKDPLLEVPPTEEEMAEARLLAEALDSGKASGADPEAISVACLLRSLSAGAGADEMASRRLRKELVGIASRRRSWRALARIAAAASFLAAIALGTFLWRAGRGPSDATLAEREREAFAAVASIGGTWNSSLSSARVAQEYDQQWQERVETALHDERVECLAEQTEDYGQSVTSPSTALPSEADPGGAS